ncbi:MAG: type II toxin-antitoxin system PemK/MazF family toxin [Candidatus Micrarchaeota archaeon]
MQQGDLVWVKVPFSSMENEKIRPALVVSNDSYNSSTLDVVICAITSNVQETPYSVLISQKDIASGSLPIPSKIRADKIFQIEKTKIIKPFARLSGNAFNQVINEINQLVSRKP